MSDEKVRKISVTIPQLTIGFELCGDERVCESCGGRGVIYDGTPEFCRDCYRGVQTQCKFCNAWESKIGGGDCAEAFIARRDQLREEELAKFHGAEKLAVGQAIERGNGIKSPVRGRSLSRHEYLWDDSAQVGRADAVIEDADGKPLMYLTGGPWTAEEVAGALNAGEELALVRASIRARRASRKLFDTIHRLWSHRDTSDAQVIRETEARLRAADHAMEAACYAVEDYYTAHPEVLEDVKDGA